MCSGSHTGEGTQDALMTLIWPKKSFKLQQTHCHACMHACMASVCGTSYDSQALAIRPHWPFRTIQNKSSFGCLL